MSNVEYIKPEFPTDAFAGTAVCYVQYRIPYPKALLADLRDRAHITGKGRLLDLACGPGRVALALSSRFQDVWAIDLEPEMIEVGRREAEQRGVANIRWIVGKAEELEAEAAAFELITIGEAFHRLDQRLITRQALRWLVPGRCLAVMGCSSVMSGAEPWQRIVSDTVRKWAGQSPAHPRPRGGPEHCQRVLEDIGFEDVASYPFVQPHDWTTESIIGFLYSSSRCSKRVLGDNVEAFEADLKAALLAHDPSGRYHQDIQCGYTLGRRPA
jgi:SAM-dependent methyltransferase